MSTPTFLAWSLLASGIFALFAFAARRLAIMKYGTLPPLAGSLRVSMFFLSLLLGGSVTKLVCDLTDMPRPAWTRVLFGTLFVALGVTYRNKDTLDGTGFASSRVLGNLWLVMGAVLLAVELVWR
jgi:hypothetical protein